MRNSKQGLTRAGRGLSWKKLKSLLAQDSPWNEVSSYSTVLKYSLALSEGSRLGLVKNKAFRGAGVGLTVWPTNLANIHCNFIFE